ncbi:hypothetical protein [Streptomyces pinistramenti]|uniref:hypothetical protein n=1 Tax=Streptomyces pinistramenti TaxID=2884812 RepID=UPI001D086C90|nr:hypothetical protein [Streptomyces pinistramenti]MCB5911661.1 hypothetical protein [Streptomyces pinistramenti]
MTRCTEQSAVMRLLDAADVAHLRIDAIGERQLLAPDGITPLYPGIPLGTAEPQVVSRIAELLWKSRYHLPHRPNPARPPASALEAEGVMAARMLRDSLLGFGHTVAVWGAARRGGAPHVMIDQPFPAAAAQQIAAALNLYDRLVPVLDNAPAPPAGRQGGAGRGDRYRRP